MKKLVVLLILIGVGGFFWWRGTTAVSTENATALTTLPAADVSGFAQALTPGAIQFPRDLGPHDDYQTEWWYYTGNLETADNRQFGYQFTIFRRALTPTPADSSGSDWRTNQIYLAHFTVSDVENGRFYQSERFSRGAAGLAGAQAEPYRVWLEDWAVEQMGPDRVRLQAKTAEFALALTLRQTLPPILHGDAGLSAKGAGSGNASYYYSLVQQETAGTVTVGGVETAVNGVSWKDHEYSTSALSDGAVGWDWFSFQFDDGSALMLGQIRDAAGKLQPFSAGTFIAADGATRALTLGDWQLTVTNTWRSPTSDATYPAAWELTIPELELVLAGRPLMPNQELTVSTIYWEGAVTFAGTRRGKPITARGYAELTGYAETMLNRF